MHIGNWQRYAAAASLAAIVGLACTPDPDVTPTTPPTFAVPRADVPTSAPTPEPTLGGRPTPTPGPTVAGGAEQEAASEPTPNPLESIRSPDAQTELTTLAAQFESALNRGDVEAAMSLFDEAAEVKIPPDVYVSPAQIRGWLEYLAANHFSAEPGFRRDTRDGITWGLEIRSDYLGRLGLPSLQGSATLVSRNRKIMSYTFVLNRDSAARHRAAQLAASQVLQDPVIVGLNSANVYGFNDVFRDTTGKLISYRDVLTSEPGTGPFYDLGGQPIVVRSGF